MVNDKNPEITHVIFDLDGLLINTEPVYTEVNSYTMAMFGRKFTLDLKALTMGMTNEAAISLMLEKVIFKILSRLPIFIIDIAYSFLFRCA